MDPGAGTIRASTAVIHRMIEGACEGFRGVRGHMHNQKLISQMLF